MLSDDKWLSTSFFTLAHSLLLLFQQLHFSFIIIIVVGQLIIVSKQFLLPHTESTKEPTENKPISSDLVFRKDTADCCAVGWGLWSDNPNLCNREVEI